MRNVFFRGSNLFTCFISIFARWKKVFDSCKILEFRRNFILSKIGRIFKRGLNVIVQEIQLDNQAGFETWNFRLSLMFYP